MAVCRVITGSVRYLLAVAALLLPTIAYAELKVAVVDQRKAILETVQGKELVKRMDAKLKPEVDQLKLLQADLQKIQQRLKADKDVLTDSEKDKISAEFEVKGR